LVGAGVGESVDVAVGCHAEQAGGVEHVVVQGEVADRELVESGGLEDVEPGGADLTDGVEETGDVEVVAPVPFPGPASALGPGPGGGSRTRWAVEGVVVTWLSFARTCLNHSGTRRRPTAPAGAAVVKVRPSRAVTA
jgi:hypothetical protein